MSTVDCGGCRYEDLEMDEFPCNKCKRVATDLFQYEQPEDKAKRLWAILGDIPINENEEIEEPFEHFSEGEDRLNIWHWFEETFHLSVAEDLMNVLGE